jgi:hypothetical protein
LFGGEVLNNQEPSFLSGFNVWMNNDLNQINIRNNNNSFIEKVELFNMLGQQVKVWDNMINTSTHQILEVTAPSAIYVVKVTTDKGEISKKVIID